MKHIKHKESGLGDLLLVLVKDIRENIRHEGLKHDLTFSQTEVLRFLGPFGKETMKSIADYLKITPPSTTEIIAELEKKGLVQRHSDKNDRRIVFVTPTQTSKKLLTYIYKRKNTIFKKMTSKLNTKDKSNLERIIRILITK